MVRIEQQCRLGAASQILFFFFSLFYMACRVGCFFWPNRELLFKGDPLIVWDNLLHSGNIPLTLNRASTWLFSFESFSNAFLPLALGIDPAASLGCA
ncbi:uncharacterized protein F4807DRAFT_422458 [Annulohypoxylon truncatum]|uniref:uncharacterized protein n=1 Tax=Annulohypoxylon truncatum TaxID=327061 RepID=UPI002007B119|nr:uncharacterized protein F4807DRAFT_422458 [Annulohypoxylon truncatum]KAI1210737.1 hypothetical protein F4807DRAFT_422458 [Annulohypoxylon truncatum]